jgi:hypothetical protein
MGEEVGRGVVADILVTPKDILTVRHTVVQARPLPENIENLEGGIERRDEQRLSLQHSMENIRRRKMPRPGCLA